MKVFEDFYKKLMGAKSESLQKSIANCHTDGLFSLVFDGAENGGLTRAFIATKKISPCEIALHTHCYPLTLAVVHGSVKHHLAYLSKGGVREDVHNRMPTYSYHSPLNGGNGLSYTGDGVFYLEEHTLPRGCAVDLDAHSLHSVSCSKGSIWIVQEHGFVTNTSSVVGAPFETNGLYTEPKQFQVNDMHKLVANKLKKMLEVHNQSLRLSN